MLDIQTYAVCYLQAFPKCDVLSAGIMPDRCALSMLPPELESHLNHINLDVRRLTLEEL